MPRGRRGLSSLRLPFRHLGKVGGPEGNRTPDSSLPARCLPFKLRARHHQSAARAGDLTFATFGMRWHGRQESNPVPRSWKPLGRHGLVRVAEDGGLEPQCRSTAPASNRARSHERFVIQWRSRRESNPTSTDRQSACLPRCIRDRGVPVRNRTASLGLRSASADLRQGQWHFRDSVPSSHLPPSGLPADSGRLRCDVCTVALSCRHQPIWTGGGR
jgi:hypothetical protein